MLLLSLPALAHLNQLSIIPVCSSLQLQNICIPITDGLTHFLIKFVSLRVPVSSKKITSKVSPPPNLPLTYYRVFISYIKNDIPQMYWVFNAHENFWNDRIAWLFSIGLKCFTPIVKCRKRVWKSQYPRKNMKPFLNFLCL